MSTPQPTRGTRAYPFSRRSHARVSLILVLALVTCLFATIRAQTANAGEVSASDRQAIAAIANDAFPDSPCRGQLTVAWAHDITPPEDDTQALAVRNGGFQLAGYAWGVRDGSCKLMVRSDLEPQRACTVAVHEAGHLALYRHGSSPIMGSPDTDDPTHPGGVIAEGYVWPACRGLVYLPLWIAEGELTDRISDTTRFQCKRASATVVDCRTSRTTGRRTVRKTARIEAHPSIDGTYITLKWTGKAVVA